MITPSGITSPSNVNFVGVKLSFNVLTAPVTVPSPIEDISVFPNSLRKYLKLLAIIDTCDL